nr:hypothetical protein [Tanacetum cinerariifolium]
GEHNSNFHPMVDFLEASPLSPSFSGRIVPLFDVMLVSQGEGSGTPIEPHHTPSSVAQTPSHTTQPTSSLPPVSTTSIPTVTSTKTIPIWQYTQRVRIAQSSTLPPVADEPASTMRDIRTGQPLLSPPPCLMIQYQGLLPLLLMRAGVEILKLKERVKVLEDREGIVAIRSGYDAPIKGRILAGGIDDVPPDSGSIPTAGPPAADIPTGSEVVPTASLVFATATVVTPYLRRKGKEVMVESDTPKKQRLQEQIDAQVTRELEENNETISKYLQEYQQFATELPLERRIELISDLSSKVKDFKGMTFEEVEAKFNSVYKQMEDFIPMGSKEEAERYKRKALQVKHPIIDWKVHKERQRSYWKIIRLGGSSACYQFFVDLLKHLDRENLNQLWILVKEYLSIRPASSDKEMELWVELKRLYKPNPEDQLSEDLQDCKLSKTARNKMHKAFPLLVRKFPLPEGTSHCLKKNATARRKAMPLPEDCTAVIVKKKMSVKDDDFLKISAPCPALYSSSNRKCNIVYKDSLYYKRSPLVRDRYQF